MRILDDVRVEPIDVRPEEWIAEIQLGDVPQRVTTLYRVRRRNAGSRLLAQSTSDALREQRMRRSEGGRANDGTRRLETTGVRTSIASTPGKFVKH